MIKGIIGMVLVGVSVVLMPLLLVRILFGDDVIKWLVDVVLDRHTEGG